MKIRFVILGLLLWCTWACGPDESPETPVLIPSPPFWGTNFIDPDILTEEDPSTFVNLSYGGQDNRTMYDRRVSDWISDTPFLFDANFDDGLTIEVQVNSEFNTVEAAEIQALKYAEVIGRLPTALRTEVETVWIHKGKELFGGGNNNILIHTAQSLEYEQEGVLEETLIHEATHTSLDANHAITQGWVDAQELDGTFISKYARDYPNREDVAESFLVYLAIQYRADRISEATAKTIGETIPNRIEYFGKQGFDMYPLE